MVTPNYIRVNGQVYKRATYAEDYIDDIENRCESVTTVMSSIIAILAEPTKVTPEDFKRVSRQISAKVYDIKSLLRYIINDTSGLRTYLQLK